jgi:hypothetical protein
MAMRILGLTVASALLLSVCPLLAGEGGSGQKEVTGGGPTIGHIPLVSVLRGAPVIIAAELIPGQSPVDSATLYVKFREVQKPVTYPLKNEGERNWQTAIPPELLIPVDHFWYYIEARDAHGVTDTHWQPVRILEPSAADHQASFARRVVPWLAGLAALLGGAAIVANNSDSGGNPAPAAAGPPSGGGAPSGGGGDQNNDCEKTGKETVNYRNLSPTGDFGSDPIEIMVCGACPDAKIAADTTWGVSARIKHYSNPDCVIGDDHLTLFLEKPERTPPVPNSETIEVYENDHRIDMKLWPPD